MARYTPTNTPIRNYAIALIISALFLYADISNQTFAPLRGIVSASSSYVQIISGSIFENIRFTFASFKQNKYLLQENKNLRDQILQIGTKDFIEKKDNEIQSLKIKAETEKAKVAKKETEKMVNPETGEPLLQVGVAYKHLRDKMAKMKEDVDYLKPKLNPSQIANIKKTWQDKKPGDVTPAVKKMIKNMDIPTQLAIKHADIKFLSKLVEDLGKEDEPKVKQIIKKLKGASQAHAGQAKDLEKVMKTEADLTKSQIKKVHDKADELPKKDFRDRYGKEKGDSVRYGVATNMVKKKLNIENKNHPSKELYETIKGLKNKADKSGMPYSILKKVYDRGMAAWRGGHRPGTSQQQWAFARVNSFVTKSSGTWGGADKDLAKQVRGSK